MFGRKSKDDNTVANGADKKSHLTPYNLWVIVFISLSSAAYGYAGSIIATTLTQPSFNEQMKLIDNPERPSLIGAMNSLYYFGGMVGSFSAGWLSDRFGRKWSVAAGNVLLLVSGAALTGSVNPGMFIFFRFVSGVGSFVNLATVPVWVAELSPPKVRGILIDIHATFMIGGYTISKYMGLAFYFVQSDDAWRGAMSLSMVLPLFILCGLYWMPESPRYLISKDRVEEAQAIVYRLHSTSDDPNNDFTRREFYQIRKQIELDRNFAVSYVEMLKDPSMRKRIWTTIWLEFCMMSSGILVILNYGSIIWKSLGFDTVQVLHFQCGFQVTGLVFNIVAMTFVDRVKRPHLIAGGMVVTALMMLGEMVLQSQYANTTHRAGNIACALFIILVQVMFSLFLDGPVFFYIAEIWPSHVRSQGFAIAMATLSLTNLLWLQAAPSAFEAIAWRFYLFFIVIPVVGACVVLKWYKDTLHKPLEEIAAVFGDADKVAVYQAGLNLAGVPDYEVNDKDGAVSDDKEASGPTSQEIDKADGKV